jgi:hypothetical protein
MNKYKTIIDDGEHHRVEYFDYLKDAVQHCVDQDGVHKHILWSDNED